MILLNHLIHEPLVELVLQSIVQKEGMLLLRTSSVNLKGSFEAVLCAKVHADLVGAKHRSYQSEGVDPNGICCPCVMGWGLAGTGNSSAAAIAVAPQNVCFGGNGFLRERVEYERSRRDTTAILIVRTLRFFFNVPKKGIVFGEGLSG